MTAILILKTAALGDVLRTTSILPGLQSRHPGSRIAWLTAPGATDLLASNPRIERIETVDLASAASRESARERLARMRWDWLISLDDEREACALATALGARRISGAHLAADGRLAYTQDCAPWFDMGLLSVHGKAEADRLKKVNARSHPEIFAAMLGLERGEPELHLPQASLAFARSFAERHALHARGPLIGLNTGAGGRWTSKQLPVERTVGLALELGRALEGRATFLIFGGPAERERNGAIREGIVGQGASGTAAVDAGSDNALLDFAALVDRCDVLVASDSLALHVGIARRVRTVAFFAPTSAAEIELYDRGEKVASTAPDACSYRPDADNSTLTVPRLAAAVLRQVALAAGTRGAR